MCLEGEEERSLWFATQLATISQKMANIETLQVIGAANDLQRRNSLYDFVD
jgi:hypothetical protein